VLCSAIWKNATFLLSRARSGARRRKARSPGGLLMALSRGCSLAPRRGAQTPLGSCVGDSGARGCPAGKPLEGDNRQCSDCAAPHAPSGCRHPASAPLGMCTPSPGLLSPSLGRLHPLRTSAYPPGHEHPLPGT